MSNYLIHYGVKGSKWGFNKGKRNGKQVAKYEYDSQGNLMEKGLINSIKARNGYQRPPMMSKARISSLKGRFNQTGGYHSYPGERGPKLAFGSRFSYKSGTAAKNRPAADSARKRAKSISNEKFSESIKDLKKMGKRAARKQTVENWLNDRKSYLSKTYESVKNKLTKSKIGSSASPKMGTNARSKVTPKMGTNARKVAPKSRVELASRKFLSEAKKSCRREKSRKFRRKKGG